MQLVYAAVGGISESDVNLAIASRAVVIGFNTRADAGARKLAEHNGCTYATTTSSMTLSMRLKAAMSGMLAPRKARRSHWYGRDSHRLCGLKIGTVAGCMVTQGLVTHAVRTTACCVTTLSFIRVSWSHSSA